MEIERKSLFIELKEDSPGSINAVFATLNVIDKDKDVTIPGAFENGAPVNIAAWGHEWAQLPTGDGKIIATDSEAMLDGKFYMSTPQGQATYNTLKERHERGIIKQEWSYGYKVLDASFGEFQGEPVRFLRKLQVIEASPVMVGAGENTRTLGIKGQNLQYTDHGEMVLAAISEFLDRSKELASLRAKEGRVLSAANRTRLSNFVERLRSLRDMEDEIDKLLEETEPDKEKALTLYTQYQKTRHILTERGII